MLFSIIVLLFVDVDSFTSNRVTSKEIIIVIMLSNSSCKRYKQIKYHMLECCVVLLEVGGGGSFHCADSCEPLQYNKYVW